MNGTAIENFACVIFNVSFMNCTWHVGRTAPEDTQYFLYWRPYRKEDFTECQNYIKDNCGRHTGCQFQNVTMKNDYTAYFLVNGSSSKKDIQPYEETIQLFEIEKLTPPLNVTVNCIEDSHRCSIWWQPPHTSHVIRNDCFQYGIEIIENKADAEKNTTTAPEINATTEKNSYLYESFNSGKRYSVKIRAKDAGWCLVSPNWGEWSTPVEFGKQQLTSSYMLFVIPGLAAGLAFFLCMAVRAYLKKTSATVPQPRDPFREHSPVDFQAEYTNLLKKQGTEEIVDIEEVVECK